MKKALCLWVAVFLPLAANAGEEPVPGLRAPAVPLVACDPYFSIWSPADTLSCTATIHWTGKIQPLTSLVRIDGKAYRLLGKSPQDLPALEQARLEVLPTRTVATFEGSGVRIKLVFTTPALPEDLSILSRPVTYITWEARSSDRGTHEVSVYFDSSTLPAVNKPDQKVVWSRESIAGLVTLRTGSQDQPILQKRGDDLRIAWGYLYVAAASTQEPSALIAPAAQARAAFLAKGRMDGEDSQSVATPAGQADFAGKYRPLLRKWAEYLKSKGFDPENQLCTDDFAGHLAHNVNLSAKAIIALGAYGELCRLGGQEKTASEFHNLAQELARRWAREADDGDHYRLAFDRNNTWSQKYNLVWDHILGLDLFPEAGLKKEMAFYRKTQRAYGLPLDNRAAYTKIDWTLWTACLTQDRGDFDALVGPVYDFLNATPDRSPMTDWYQTDTARRVGFTARPVVGGLLLRALYDPAVWKKYASRDQRSVTQWAPFPAASKGL
jgi:hypothetical protein